MAVIHRVAGGFGAAARQASRTVLGRPPLPANRLEAPEPLDAREQLELDAVLARTWRTSADRLAAEEEALAPEQATGFAARVGAAFDAESERTLADLNPRLRPRALSGLSAIGEEIVGAAADYEDLATRIGLFNTAKRATDDIAALIVHDRSAHDRLREEGLSRLARAPLSDGARALLEQRLLSRLAHGHAVAHIDDDPAEAHAVLTAAAGEPPSPYDLLSDEQRQRYAARAETADARKRAASVQSAGQQRPDAETVANPSVPEEIDTAEVPERDRLTEDQAAAWEPHETKDDGDWNHAALAEEVEDLWKERGGSVSELVGGDKSTLDFLLDLTRDTGLVPAPVRSELMRIAEDGTRAERQAATLVVEQLSAARSEGTALPAASIFADFKLSDEVLEQVSREVSPELLASMLYQLRVLNQPHADNSGAKSAFKEMLLEDFSGSPATQSLLMNRYRMVAGDYPDVRAHPDMFSPEFAESYAANLSQREAIFGFLVDLTPLVGDIKAAFELSGALYDWKQAIAVGDRALARGAKIDFFIKLTDVFPGPSIVGVSKKLLAKIDSLPLPDTFKKEVQEWLGEQSLLSESAWRKRGQAQRIADNRIAGKIAEDQYAAGAEAAALTHITRQLGIKTPSGQRFVDFAGFEKGELRLLEHKTPPAKGKRGISRKFRQDPKQARKDSEIGMGMGVFTRDFPPYFKKGDKVPAAAVRKIFGEPTPTGWQKIWRLRIRKK